MNFSFRKLQNYSSSGLLVGVVLCLCSCSIFGSNEEAAPKKLEIYKVAFRQLPPAPVYNRIRIVKLPDVTPDSSKPASDAVQLDPQVKLKLRNNTLEQAAIALASLGKYHAYTASSVAKQKVSIEAYGTLEEVAQQLANKSGAHIVVDHQNKQISILKDSIEDVGIKPSFAEDNTSEVHVVK